LLAASLIIVATIAVALALPLGLFVRLGILVAGMALGLAATQFGQDVLALGRLIAIDELSQSTSPSDSQDQVTVTYKVTATVRVNGELRSGSSLQRVTIRRQATFGLQAVSNTSARFHGEAVAVPIVDDTYLLVTVSGRNSYEQLLVSPCRDWRQEGRLDPPSADEILSNAANFSGRCALALNRLPFMLAVRGTEELTGFVSVSPQDLSAAFDASVEFVSLEFLRTDEPLQYKLHEQLHWVDDMNSEEHKFGIKVMQPDGSTTAIEWSTILVREATT
jgi:hypothetical protein